MNLLEEMKKLTQQTPELFFVPKFLTTHPDAELYLVGGAVRDLLLGRKMRDVDFDFVIRNLERDKIESWFGQRGSLDLAGKTFGVFKFMPNDVDPHNTNFIDIALPRTEQSHKGSVGGYKEFDVQSDPSLPIEDDLSRRDFTINAMAINMRTGEIIDPHKGKFDLDRRRIKAVGNPEDRFNEDLSRMLRAIRFASELHFMIELETFEAIRKKISEVNLKKDGEYVIPREVLGLELAKALSRSPAGAAMWLEKTGALKELFPDLTQTAMDPLNQLKEGKVEIAIILMLRDLDPERAKELLIETGLHSLPKESRLRINVETVLWAIKRLKEAKDHNFVQGMPAHRFEKVFMNGKGLMMMELLERVGKADLANMARDKKASIEDRWKIEPTQKIPVLISGDDVLSAGVEAGPKVREILDTIRDEQLEGAIMTRDEAIKRLTALKI